MKRVVIIGAGPCGLAALKETIAAGHEAFIVERSAVLGGTFASSAVYPNLHLTISNWLMAFSDFPDPERMQYASARHYLDYLQRYARHFDLDRHIRFNSEVVAAKVGNDGRWQIKIQEEDKPTLLNIEADALIVATGANQVPKECPSQLAAFTGRILHSSQYNDALKREVAEKKLRVLVVGGGESGADIAAELGELSPNVTVWLRRPACIGPRYLNRHNERPQMEANKIQDFPANGFLEAATTSRMSSGLSAYTYGAFRRFLWNMPILNPTMSKMCLDSTANAVVLNDQATYVTKNQCMAEALQQCKIEVLISPDVSCRQQTCDFSLKDGTVSRREFDVIVLCTGFRAEFPWLEVEDFDSNPRSWFLHCFPERLGHCLFFVGYARPHQGGIPALAEMLSRYIGLLLSGERKLPANYAEKSKVDKVAEREYYALSPNLDTLVDYNAFMESVARLIGCEPRLPASCIVAFNVHMLLVAMLSFGLIWSNCNPLGWRVALFQLILTMASFLALHNGLLIKWWIYPQWPVWYRQRGPGASPSSFEQVVERINIWKSTAITRGFILFIVCCVPAFYVQRLVSVFAFMPHAILTALTVRWSKGWGALLRPKLFALHSAEWRVLDLLLP